MSLPLPPPLSRPRPRPGFRSRYGVLAAVLALLAGLFVAAERANAAETLLSQGKPATASSTESSSYAAAYAVDGNTTSTRWASAEGHDPEWLTIDLGATYAISRVKLYWEAAYAAAYQVQTSADGASWTTIHTTSQGDGGTDDRTGLSGSGRYVRVLGTARGTSYGYSLYEVQVYGEAGSTPSPSPSVTPTAGPVDYQAEDATLSQAAVATNHTGYTGTGFVDYAAVTGGYVEWTVNATTAGNATLSLRYANGKTTDRPVDIAVNGVVVARPAFPATGGWDTWTTVDVVAALPSGTSKVRATAANTVDGPNLDKLTVTPGGTASPSPSPSSSPTQGGAFTVVAAGDIAAQCTASSSSCAHPKTAAQVQAINPEFVVTMGDNQYDDGTIDDFRKYYATTWGTFKDKTHPSAGNHESYDPAGFEAGYKSYFGAIAFPNGKSWYSFDRGNWHFIALDSNIFDQTAQINWLKADLAATTKGCVAAYWHHPLFSSGEHGNDPVSRPVWQILYDARADLVLNGHDHHYERFAPQNPSGQADANGLVELLGGMGGADPYTIENVQPNSQFRLSGTYGVVKLAFTDSTYSWQLIGTDGKVKDSSPTYTCH
ncbi:discoidin domain-containing protein [Microtetraspora sp. AC03309]|uniref:discoidin domain-containing protein n=1 Tax=Microtetraspora sp. AC03309 TaxID=2779376 RepID=UPI001E3FE989|nr:discoidin domain-containing protein [Microtetraspora sp. AC03309]MCC5581317.1 discoidin domain-containing protein [Microtetraspora sp. AC03309]